MMKPGTAAKALPTAAPARVSAPPQRRKSGPPALPSIPPPAPLASATVKDEVIPLSDGDFQIVPGEPPRPKSAPPQTFCIRSDRKSVV
jgi:hypothetical protein